MTDTATRRAERTDKAALRIDAERHADIEERKIAPLTQLPAVEYKADAAPLKALLQNSTDNAQVDHLDAEADRLQALVDRIERDRVAAEQRLEELEDSRGDVVLNGGDIDKLHKNLRDAEQLADTLEAGLAPARAMLAKARTNARKAAIERKAAAVKDEHFAAAADATCKLYELLAAVGHAGKLIDQHVEAIESLNHQARAADRPDLVMELSRLRTAVVDKLGTAHASLVVPLRMGETDEAFEARLLASVADVANGVQSGKRRPDVPTMAACRAMRIERQEGEVEKAYTAHQWAAVATTLRSPRAEGEPEADHHERVREALARLLNTARKGESDAAYSLRVANAHARVSSLRDAADPLRVVGDNAIAAIRKYALGVDAATLHRLQQGSPSPGLRPGDVPKEIRTNAYGPLARPVSPPTRG